ncbi:MAG TPA: DUF1080 domain-containing protein [Chthoniobacteraceae bacterium]|nr:DUF1080 domain-containing protein [Chthoniobacteraceae bacterium]
MKTLPSLLALAASVVFAHAGEREIFNGKDLTGWKGQAEFWSVQDGAITGRTTAENMVKENTFLIWQDGEVGDFVLTCKYKLVDANGKAEGFGNSGVQYRSKVVKPEYSVVAGYQADMECGKTYSGILYEEKGRGILAKRGEKVVIKDSDDPKKPKIEKVGELGASEEIQAAIHPADWNEYKIVAKGNHLQHFINGKQTVDVIDETSVGAKSGVLALQLHKSATGMTVQFKDLVLKTE